MNKVSYTGSHDLDHLNFYFKGTKKKVTSKQKWREGGRIQSIVGRRELDASFYSPEEGEVKPSSIFIWLIA
jgi:hypothetical protein